MDLNLIKYMKYKNKYLELLNNIGGAKTTTTPLSRKPPIPILSRRLPDPSKSKLPDPPPQPIPQELTVKLTNIIEHCKIIILTGGTGTIGKALIQLLKDNKDYFIIYTTRECKKTDTYTNTFCFDIDFNSKVTSLYYNSFLEMIKQLKQILSNKQFYIINTAADKDSNIVKASYLTKDKSLNSNSVINIDDHWSIILATTLATLSKALSIVYIHLSTVYVNKDGHSENEWSNDLVSIPDKNTIQISDPYIYGLIKAVAENRILDINEKSIIFRLPVIMDKNITKLSETSPSSVLLDIINKISLSQPIKMNNVNKRCPLSAQTVSNIIKLIIDCISYDKYMGADHTTNNNIICLSNKNNITKHKIGQIALQWLQDNNIITKKNTPAIIEDTEYSIGLPKTETMKLVINSDIFDSNIESIILSLLDEDISITINEMFDNYYQKIKLKSLKNG